MTKSFESIEDWLQQRDVVSYARGRGSEAWTTLFSKQPASQGESVAEFAAFSPPEERERVLRSTTWDMSYTGGRPGFVVRYCDGDEIPEYLPFGSDRGLSPIVTLASHHGAKPAMLPQISEEFRFFHNLWTDDGKTYLTVDENGSASKAAEVTHDLVRVRTPLLVQFQAAKQLDLLLFVDSLRTSPPQPHLDDDELGLWRETYVGDDHILSLSNGRFSKDDKISSSLMGKTLLLPMPIENCGMWPFDERTEHYPEFAVGETSDGKPILASCDPHLLQGDGEGHAHYLRSVFFRRDVLKKYYELPELFDVEDGLLRCNGLWTVTIDNNHPDHVMVFLGDLGRDVPESERYHWKHFEIAPIGHMSSTSALRNLAGHFAEPQMADLKFKEVYRRFAKGWEAKFGWRLFKELQPADQHVLQRLRVPLDESQPEFEDQILGLTKLLVDRLNEKELSKGTDNPIPGAKGIQKFDQWLNEHDFASREPQIAYLKRLQELRSRMAAHSKGSDYEKFLKKQGVEGDFANEMTQELDKATDLLCSLAEHFDVDL